MEEELKLWLEKNTFGHESFKDISQLLYLKEKKNSRVTLSLATYNNEKTIENIIRIIKDELMDKFSLIDEVVVVDRNSIDETEMIVERLDVKFFYANQILPGLPRHFRGKGESIWKSLAVSKGDIIVWLDADILNFSPQFVYGLLGPLLLYDTINFVKGFYRLSSKDKNEYYEEEKDPVTDILIKPFLNLFYPELAGIFQPLSGECAGRREVLESIPFFSGYGMELGLLIDIYRRWGSETIGQVDLGWRFRHSKTDCELSRISFGTLQMIFNRLHDDEKIDLRHELSDRYHRFRAKDEGVFLETDIVREGRRPPMRDIMRMKQGVKIE